jgi:hypothetical protein
MLEQMFFDTFKNLGKPALYQAGDSALVEILALIKEPEQAYELGDGHFGAGSFVERIATFEVMAKDIPNPKVGDTLYIEGRKYKIYQEPLLDGSGNVFEVVAILVGGNIDVSN